MMSLIAISLLEGRHPSWIPVALADLTQFVALVENYNQSNPERNGYARFERLTDGAIFQVSVEPGTSVGAFLPAAVVPQLEVPEDGIPLGGRCRIVLQSESAIVSTFFESVLQSNSGLIVRLEVFSPKLIGRKVESDRVYDFRREVPWLVSLLRETISKNAAHRASPIEQMSFKARQVSSFLVTGSDALYVSLDDYAAAMGAALNKNEKNWRYSLTVGGTEVVVALGTNKVKVGGKWLDMLDVPILKDGKVWVPMERLPQ